MQGERIDGRRDLRKREEYRTPLHTGCPRLCHRSRTSPDPGYQSTRSWSARFRVGASVHPVLLLAGACYGNGVGPFASLRSVATGKMSPTVGNSRRDDGP